MSNLPQIENKFSFIQITLEELLELREAKVLSKNAYITMCLRFEQPYEDKELLINIEAFCEKWQISKADYYRCLRKLKEIGAEILNRLTHICKFDRRKKPTEKTISQTGVTKSITEKSESQTPVTKFKTKNALEPLENKECSFVRLKENNNLIEEKEKNKCAISSEEKQLRQNAEFTEEKNIPIPDKPYEYEPLIKYVSGEFCRKYGESSGKARQNAISHLKNKKKAEKRWREYVEFIQAKERAELRYRETLQRQKENQAIPVNFSALAKITDFLKGKKTTTNSTI